MRAHLTADEFAVLFNAYAEIQAELGPITGMMTDAEMDALIVRLQEGARSFPLDSLSWGARTQLISHMAEALRNYATAKSSVGSPPAKSGDDNTGEP